MTKEFGNIIDSLQELQGNYEKATKLNGEYETKKKECEARLEEKENNYSQLLKKYEFLIKKVRTFAQSFISQEIINFDIQIDTSEPLPKKSKIKRIKVEDNVIKNYDTIIENLDELENIKNKL